MTSWRTANLASAQALLLLSSLALAGCGDSGRDDGGGRAGSGAGSGGSGGEAATSGVSVGAGGGNSGGTSGGMSGAAGSGTSSAEAAACEAMTVDFTEPGATEYVQWSLDGAKKEARPPAGGAYFFNGYLNLTTYAADLSGSVSVAVMGAQQESFPAGTYHCREGELKASVNVNSLGLANSTTPGADCAVTYDEAVEDGGKLQGTFWAYVPPTEWPFKFDGGCVHGRFEVTDAAD